MNKRPEVLLIDADPQLGPLTARWLTQRGATVTVVRSVADALDRGGRWDALLFDDSCGVPDADEVAALRELTSRFVVSGARVPGVELQLAKPHAFDRLADLVLAASPRRHAPVRVTRGPVRRSRAAPARPRRGSPPADRRTR